LETANEKNINLKEMQKTNTVRRLTIRKRSKNFEFWASVPGERTQLTRAQAGDIYELHRDKTKTESFDVMMDVFQKGDRLSFFMDF